MKVTQEQKSKLKELLTEREYNTVFSLDGEEFFSMLDNCIVDRFEDDEPTDEALAIQRIYDEIYLQN